jgi:hypothetical protein
MKILNFALILALSLQFFSSCKNQKESLSLNSPDNTIQVNVELKENKNLVYNITKNGKLVLDSSKLGIIRKDGNFSTGLSLVSVSEVEKINENYSLKVGKKLNIDYQANKKTFHFENAEGKKIDIIFQVSNDGVAFRYYFPETSNEIKYIDEEITSFKFPKGTKAWLQPCADAKTGWHRSQPSYEESYLMDIPVGTESPFKAGWVFPALFKSDDTWIAVSETGIDGKYCVNRLRQQSPNGEYYLGFPQKDEVVGSGELNPQSQTPWYSPWRIMAIGSLKTVTESTLGTDLALPTTTGDFSWVKPGRASWSWVLLKDDFTAFPVQKKFIDYASDMGWEYCLVDGYWDTKIGYEKIKQLCDYAKTKNVGILLWYNSAGPWNETPITPRDLMLTHESRLSEFKKIKEMGVKGVKVDFFGADGQSAVQYYIDILKDASDIGLMVNCHGSTLPRGLQRTYPNLVSMEAIKGMEFITFEQKNADSALTHCALIPFTRNIFDPMDFTPVSFSEVPNIKRLSSNGFELALSVLFISGIQHYAEIPEGMAKVPDYVKQAMKDVPSVWEESKFIDGYPGKYVVMARRSADKWYIAGINAQESDKELSLDLIDFAGMKGSIITDGKDNRSFTKTDITIDNTGKLNVLIKSRGGFLIQISK